MRKIHLEDDLRLRFPGRTEQFDDGVEIGMVAALMALGHRNIERSISVAALETVRSVAQRLGYRVLVQDLDEELVRVTLENTACRPELRIVSR